MNKLCILGVQAYGYPYTYIRKSPLYHDVTPSSTNFAFLCKNSVIQYTLTIIKWNLLLVQMTYFCLGSVPAESQWKSVVINKNGSRSRVRYVNLMAHSVHGCFTSLLKGKIQSSEI